MLETLLIMSSLILFSLFIFVIIRGHFVLREIQDNATVFILGI
ncbi:hypothetical protein ACR31S_08385 [Streptococcus iniae]